MKANGIIVSLVAVSAWVAVAVLFTTGTLSGTHAPVLPSGPSPACLPATLAHTATLEGTSVNVSPAPGTDSASPYTQISFLGVRAADIHDVSVTGSRSGYHYGQLRSYSQGDGASFTLDTPLEAGEQVTVSAVIGRGTAQRRVGFAFEVSTPYPTAQIPQFPNPAASAADTQSFTSAPSLHPPVLSVTTPDRDPRAGDILMTTGPGPGQYGPLIYTPQGRVVWFEPQPPGLTAENLSVQRYDGRPALTWWRGRVLALGFGQGEDVVTDSNYQTVATIKGGNGLQADLHDFQLAPDHVAYVTAYSPIRCDLTAAGGAHNGVLIDTAVQEIDIETGLVRWEWHSLDHVRVTESRAPVPSGSTPWDWFHLNSIDVRHDGDLFVSARSTWAGYYLKAGSGRVLWRLGGRESSFRMLAGAETAWQHDGRVLPDGTVTFFDNGSNPRVHYQARAVHLALDSKTHTARLLRAYTHPSPLASDSQGDAQTLGDGNVVLGFGALPYVSEFDAQGSLLFDAHLAPGFDSYRAFRFPWRGHPLKAPSVSAAVLATDDETAVYASWNGSTEVASWRVLAGKTAGSVQPRATMPNGGFESSLILTDAYRYAAVQALDSAGRLLASSRVARVAQPRPSTSG